jgi:hypothetical protein
MMRPNNLILSIDVYCPDRPSSSRRSLSFPKKLIRTMGDDGGFKRSTPEELAQLRDTFDALGADWRSRFFRSAAIWEERSARYW